jgi:hypothetical protein
MELDHVFVLIDPGGPELAYLKSLGLIETYRRQHPGQGKHWVGCAIPPKPPVLL